ncbi:zinc ribbon domain-containing protein [candidate division TA06 bacterium]|nr:zinc ribbon domain-containing protein [candidate division TA06 bacterium]
MPTYEYECSSCGHRFERFQSIKEAAVKRCPRCRGKVQRLISAGGGILFKGSGFYTTDYRSEDYKKAAKKEKEKKEKKPLPSKKSKGGGGNKSS